MAADAPEFVFVTLSEAFVTAGTERPGLLLKRNPRVTRGDIDQQPADEVVEEETVDVLVFHHAEDRAGSALAEYIRMPLSAIRAPGGAPSAPRAFESGDPGSGGNGGRIVYDSRGKAR